jgi:predicted RNase H-like HicB family nuclease
VRVAGILIDEERTVRQAEYKGRETLPSCRYHGRENSMKINIVYREEKGWFVGHIQEYPDYESQGKTLQELRDNLVEIYEDITKGLVPDAEPFHILEVATQA